MEGRMATYTLNGDADELARRAEEGILPLLESQPGFKSYTIAVGDGEVFSMSAGTREPTPRPAAKLSPPGSPRTWPTRSP